MSLKHAILTAPGDRFFDEIRQQLLARLPLEEQRTRNLKRIWYDTFDSRLRKNGLIIEQIEHGQERWLLLRTLGSGQLQFQIQLQKTVKFYDDLPEGVFRNKLRRLIKYRALLPVSSTDAHNVEMIMSDVEGKAIVRLDIENVENGQQARRASRTYAWLRAVRGHDKDARKLATYLTKKLGFKPCDIDPALLGQPSSQFFPQDYSAKLSVKLKRKEKADVAVARVLNKLLQLKRVNEPGMLKKVDTEFLHDYRIAIRQSRSLLAQLSEVYPAQQVKRLKKEFAWLSERTSDLRDYDVFLLKFERYEKELPWDMREHLEPLRSYLTKSQKLKQQQLKRTLASARYRRFMEVWEGLLQAPEQTRKRAANSQKPVLEVANQAMWKVYRKIMKQGLVITNDSPIDELHDLRKTGKKLRYLIECFGTLYEQKYISQVAEELTALQDVLGNLTDLDVQKNLLAKWADEMQHAHVGGEQSQNAIHTLEHILAKREDKKKREFVDCFAGFARDENRKLFKKLFGNKAV